MYHVLIVDDEKNVTDFLKTAIPWPYLGVDAVYTAADGMQALGILSNFPIDLLITDIRMPHMDGLTLLEKARKDYPEIHCILLTAYGEFEYARKAISLGIDNYLLKPINMDELTTTIETALDNIYIHRKQRSDLFRENLLKRWITGAITYDELGEKAVLTDLNIYLPFYCVVAFRKQGQSISLMALCEIIKEKVYGKLTVETVWDNNSHCMMLLGGQSIDIPALKDVISNVVAGSKQHENIYAGIGARVQSGSDVAISYRSAINMMAKSTDQITVAQEAPCEPDRTQLPDKNSLDLSPIVRRTIEYIEENYASGVSMKEFSSLMNVNAAYIGYLFKKETGLYFNNYLNEYRVQIAIRLLCETSDRIGEIAEKTGFTATSHFISTFKRSTGLSPLKYRENYGGKTK